MVPVALRMPTSAAGILLAFMPVYTSDACVKLGDDVCAEHGRMLCRGCSHQEAKPDRQQYRGQGVHCSGRDAQGVRSVPFLNGLHCLQPIPQVGVTVPIHSCVMLFCTCLGPRSACEICAGPAGSCRPPEGVAAVHGREPSHRSTCVCSSTRRWCLWSSIAIASTMMAPLLLQKPSQRTPL